MGESTTLSSGLNATQSKFDFAVMDQKLTQATELFRTSVIGIGMFLNVVVLLVVSLSRQLRYPRHIFWAAVSLFECFILLEYSLELAVIINRNHLACTVLVLICSVDYSLLLLCLSLTALDRYLSIVRYEWYLANVTCRGVVLVITIASALTLTIIDIPFWAGYQSIYTCTISMTHHHWISAWNLVLGIVCVVLHFKTFVETKTLIRQYVPTYRRPPVTIRFTNPSIQQSNNASSGPGNTWTTESVVITFTENPSTDVGRENVKLQQPEDSQRVSSVDGQIDKEYFPSKQSRSKFNRLEIQAALNMSVNILPFWLCTFPVSCNAIALYWCIRLEGNCDPIVLTWTYAWDVFMLHSVYNPVMYIATSPEFRRAIFHASRKLMNKCRSKATAMASNIRRLRSSSCDARVM